MNSQLDKHLINFLVHKISSYDFKTECKIDIRKFWNQSNIYVISRGDYKTDDEYKKHLTDIFSSVYTTTLIESLTNSNMDIDFMVSLIQYISSYQSIMKFDTLCREISNVYSRVGDVYNKLDKNDNNNNDSDNDNSNNNDSSTSDNIEKSLKKLKKIKRTQEEKFSDLRDDVRSVESHITQENKLVKNEINDLERKVDIIDDKFNLLSSFVDMVANK